MRSFLLLLMVVSAGLMDAAPAPSGRPLPRFDPALLARGFSGLRLRPFVKNGWTKGRALPQSVEINLTPGEILDVISLGLEAWEIQKRALAREAKHRKALAARGIAEVPPCESACRYRMDLGKNTFLFDVWGEFYIDRRFVTEQEMTVVHRLEAYYRKVFSGSAYARQPAGAVAPGKRPPSRGKPSAPAPFQTRAEARKGWKVPIFRGFEDDRYQQHDDLIVKLTADFNAHREAWIGGTSAQAAKVGILTPALVKAHMVEESGGNGPRSQAAWRVDPLQVNVPGDWTDVKMDLGLTRPMKRNEGTAEGNVRAAIMFLARKGFGVSGQPVRKRPEGFFDGWPTALQRYNARRDRTADDRFYSDAYADKILSRAKNPDLFVPIEIKLAAVRKQAGQVEKKIGGMAK